jgi:hypothetical protein
MAASRFAPRTGPGPSSSAAWESSRSCACSARRRACERPGPWGERGLSRLAAVGFALGTCHVSFLLAAAVIGTVSVVMSLAGLELGARIGMRAGQRGELIGGLILIGVGVAIGTGVI